MKNMSDFRKTRNRTV